MTSSPASESLEHARFAVVDVETTGVRAQVGGRILEVAVAILEGGTIHLAFEALLDPGTPIPLWVARLTGITDGMVAGRPRNGGDRRDRKSTRLNSSHGYISYAVFCLKKKKKARNFLRQAPEQPIK